MSGSGRRSHQRFGVPATVEGTLRILRDVLVESASESELVVFSRHAGVQGETLSFEMAESGIEPFPVEVVESRPVVTEGVVRHRVTLKMTGEA